MKYATLFALAAASCVHTIDFEERALEWTVGQRVNTTSGAVLGHPATNDLEVSEYLGIPYGQAPIGDFRFAAPVRFNGTVNLDGSAFRASCPVRPGSSSVYTVAQLAAANVTSVGIQALAIFSNTGANYSEDCLYVNVWTKPQTGDATKAVLVWIHGGAFSSGSSTIPAYNGASFAGQEDVVVVSFNYRLNVLGFPGNPSGPNNLGLLDQRLAVEWVRDNIANFGGDPSRITIFGQSAGGASVDFYSYAWNSDPIAAGFIPESGNVFSWGLPNSKITSAENWFNVTSTLGCGNASSDSAAVISCMRKQNYNAILAAMPTSSGLSSVLGGFIPTVDDTVVFSNYSQRTPAKVPMLIGNNNYEGGLFRTSYALQGVILPDVFWDNFNLQEYTCPCGIRANASISADNPTWRYRYYGVFPNLALSSEAGAYHEAEIPLLFNTVPANPASTEAEISIGNYMRKAWAAFAKDPANGLTALGWPTYNTNGDTLIRLAYGNTTGPNVINPYYSDSDCVLVNASSTNASNYPILSATVSSNPTSSATATGSSTAATTSKGAGGKVEIGVWVGFGALIMGSLL